MLFLIFFPNISAHKIKYKVILGHLVCNPVLDRKKNSDINPFWMIHDSVPFLKILIHLKIESPKLYKKKNSINFYETVSNDFQSQLLNKAL